MTFLSLAKGDPTARQLLGNAIKARYGVRPIMLSSLLLELEIKSRGRFGLPLTRTVQARYVDTTHRRWDETEKLLRFVRSKMTESYDGGTFYWRKGDAAAEVINTPEALRGIRNQVWLEMALFLTPLTEEGVVLKSLDATTLQANPAANASEQATLYLNVDHTLKYVQADCFSLSRQAPAKLMIRPADGLRALNGFTVPVKLVYEWDGEPAVSYTVINAEADPKIPLTEFSIG